MKLSEAFKLLEEGKKIRKKSWKKGDYIHLNKINRIFDKNDIFCPILITDNNGEWEEFIENKTKTIMVQPLLKESDRIRKINDKWCLVIGGQNEKEL